MPQQCIPKSRDKICSGAEAPIILYSLPATEIGFGNKRAGHRTAWKHKGCCASNHTKHPKATAKKQVNQERPNYFFKIIWPIEKRKISSIPCGSLKYAVTAEKKQVIFSSENASALFAKAAV